MIDTTGVVRNGVIVPDSSVDSPDGKRVRIVEELDEVEAIDFSDIRFRETPDDVHDPAEIQGILALLAEIQSEPPPEPDPSLERYFAENKRLQKEAMRERWGLES